MQKLITTLVTCLLLFSHPSHAQEIPRTSSGLPDLQGIWKAETRAAYNLLDHVANADILPGKGVVEGGELPYQTWAAEQQRLNFEQRLQEDPLRSCYLPSVPRIMAMDHPFQIFQTDDQLAITFEWSQVFRLIAISEADSLYDGVESWMGRGRGHWEGNTFVVLVKDFNDRSWLDASGNFHSTSMQLEERYSMIDPDTLMYQVTVTDPEIFSRPWTMGFTLHRQTQSDRLLEYHCQAEKEELNGDFERDERTWYPAPVPEPNSIFRSEAGLELELPEIAETLSTRHDGTPDLNGYYMADAGGANYGLETSSGGFLLPQARGVVIDPSNGTLPYQDWARLERDDRLLPHRGYDDPTAHCFVAGIPRSHYVPAPFYIIQTDNYVVLLHERMAWRQISLSRDQHLPDHMRLWQGDSIGYWQDGSLIVESRNFNGKAWLNEAGDVISHRQTVRETFTPVSDNQILYRATISDPIAYTRPWTIEIPFNQSDDELLEVACLEDNNDLEHLRDVRDEYRALQQEQ